MTRAFRLYEWLGPLLLLPTAWWLWLRASDGNRAVAALALAVPVIHGYVVPAIGTNVLKVWGFNTRLRIGNFRPQHGFLFGSASAAIAALVFLALGAAASSVARIGLTGLVLLAVNWIYDALAIRHGVLEVRNQPWAEGRSEWAIAADYVVWFFGLTGAIYAALADRALALLPPAPGAGTLALWIAGGAAATMLAPTLCYVAASWLRFGHSGCRPVARPEASHG